MFIAELDMNNKVNEVKEVGEAYAGTGIKIDSYDIKLMGTTYQNGTFTGYYINLSTDKNNISADGIDKATLTATVFNYDDTPATNYSDNIIFNVNGTEQNIPCVNGVATIQFTSSIAGTFTIKTNNNIINNGEVNIIAS